MLTTGEVAKLFQVSAQTVINWLDQGRMPFERIGRGPRRLTEETVLKYIKDIGISVTALDPTIYAKTLKTLEEESSNGHEMPIAVLNPELEVISWSEGVHSITEVAPTEAVGKRLLHIIPQVQGTGQSIEALIRGIWQGPTVEANVFTKAKDGKMLRFHVSLSKIYSQGALAGYTLFVS